MRSLVWHRRHDARWHNHNAFWYSELVLRCGPDPEILRDNKSTLATLTNERLRVERVTIARHENVAAVGFQAYVTPRGQRADLAFSSVCGLIQKRSKSSLYWFRAANVHLIGCDFGGDCRRASSLHP